MGQLNLVLGNLSLERDEIVPQLLQGDVFGRRDLEVNVDEWVRRDLQLLLHCELPDGHQVLLQSGLNLPIKVERIPTACSHGQSFSTSERLSTSLRLCWIDHCP